MRQLLRVFGDCVFLQVTWVVPSCAARRAHESCAHLDDVLPQIAFRQWTLSLPWELRWVVVRDVKLLRAVERRL